MEYWTQCILESAENYQQLESNKERNLPFSSSSAIYLQAKMQKTARACHFIPTLRRLCACPTNVHVRLLIKSLWAYNAIFKALTSFNCMPIKFSVRSLWRHCCLVQSLGRRLGGTPRSSSRLTSLPTSLSVLTPRALQREPKNSVGQTTHWHNSREHGQRLFCATCITTLPVISSWSCL